MTLKSAQEYDIFFNVALETLYSKDIVRPRIDTEYYHAPIDEDHFWGYEGILMSKIILDEAFDKNKKTYLHCHSGANRSPTVAAFWLYSKVGDMKKACEILSDNPQAQINRIEFYQNLNFIPKEIDKLFDRYERFGNDIERILNTEPKIRTDIVAKR